LVDGCPVLRCPWQGHGLVADTWYSDPVEEHGCVLREGVAHLRDVPEPEELVSHVQSVDEVLRCNEVIP
jgi:hypothetical protein